MNQEIVDKFNDGCREAEALLEKLGQMICDLPKSAESWSNITMAVSCVQRAISSSFLMVNE